jgi:fructose-1,6-bisphosphatase/inositol monophosphatase family enzyme
MTQQLDQLRSVAVEAVHTGMGVVAEWVHAGRDLRTERVGDVPGDEFVTAVDVASEAAIRRLLHAATPSIPVVGETRAESDLDAPWVWVVDPVDGTTNLVNGDPFVSVTVALLASGDPVLGATGCPFTEELWSAQAGRGAEDAHGRQLEMGRQPPAAPSRSIRRHQVPPTHPSGRTPCSGCATCLPTFVHSAQSRSRWRVSRVGITTGSYL